MRLRFGSCRFDSERRQLIRDGREQHLSRKAFDLLSRLVDARPNLVGKRELMDHLWPDTFVSEANLGVLISEVRGALGDSARSPTVIRTHHGLGYAFIADAVEAPPITATPAPGPRHALVAGQRRIDLLEGVTSVGRDHQCDIVLDDPSVSRRHALLHVSGGRIEVEDLASKNGTLVDGTPARGRAVIGGGASLTFGTVECTVVTAPASGASTLTVNVTRDGR